MQLKPLAPNQTVLVLNNDVSILFSYSTPVAAFVPGRGYIATTTKYSATTSRHINTWTEGRATPVPQAEIDTLTAGGRPNA